MPIAQSSNLQAYDYEPNSQTLTIQFLNGSIYQYQGVPLTEYDNFRQSGGTGTYFHAKIRDRYPFTKLVGPREKKK